MELILVEDVANLGHIGDLVKVKPGFGRNFLLPRKMAVAASMKNKAKLDHDQRVLGFRIQKAKAEAETAVKQISAMTVTIARKVGEQDKMFGSVTSHDVAQALVAMGVKVDRRKVVLEEPIRQLGDYKVTLKLRPDVAGQVSVKVVAE